MTTNVPAPRRGAVPALVHRMRVALAKVAHAAADALMQVAVAQVREWGRGGIACFRLGSMLCVST